MVDMDTDHLLSIGGFALISGLSIPALRHYDDVDVLRPAYVDPTTGYRRYEPAQVREARLICALRGVDLPVDDIRTIVRSMEDGELVESVLDQHRGRLAERKDQLDRMAITLDTYLEKGIPVPTQTSSRIVQVMIPTRDLEESVTFYSQVFDARFDENVSSFVFGAWQTDSFFLLTIENWDGAGSSSFGIYVDDVDATHQRALAAGATQLQPPMDFEWKPRSSYVADPSGNRVQLSQR